MSEGIQQPPGPSDSAPSPASLSAVSPVSTEELRTVESLRDGNETAFVSLIERHHASMLHMAMVYIPNRAVAEEIVQEAWMGVLQGLKRFEGRSSLKTWIFRILTNCAKTRAQREGRSIPFSSLPALDADDSSEPAVDPDRFQGPDGRWPGHWVSFPRSWDEIPEERLLSQETRAHIQRAIDALLPHQREVITLRDIEGWSSDEICSFLGVSEANVRVLLHRARAKVNGDEAELNALTRSLVISGNETAVRDRVQELLASGLDELLLLAIPIADEAMERKQLLRLIGTL